MTGNDRLFSRPFFLMCGFTFTVFLSLFQLLPTAPFRILDLGGSTVAAGLFLGLLTYASALSAPFTGALADRFGRRRMLLVSSLAIAGFSAAYAFATSWRLLVGLAFFHGLFWSGLLSASAAYITGLIPHGRRAEGIGYWGMATVLATAFAPTSASPCTAAAGARSARPSGCSTSSWRRSRGACRNPRGPPGQPARCSSRGTSSSGASSPVSMSLFLCSFGYGGVTSFVAMWTEKSGLAPEGASSSPSSRSPSSSSGRSSAGSPTASGRAASSSRFSASSPSRSRSSPSRRPARSSRWLAVLFGAGFGNMYTVYAAHVTKFVAPERRGAAFGAILAAFDIGIGTGSIALGAVIGHAGFPAAYGTAAAVAVLSMPAFLLLDRHAFPPKGAVS